MRIIKNITIQIDEKEVLRYQGFPVSESEKIKIKQNILHITREEINNAYFLYEPQGIYSSLTVEKIMQEGKVILMNGKYLEFNNSIIELLKGVKFLIVGLVTIGNKVEKKVSELFNQGEYSRAIALDAVGTVAAKYLRNHLNSLVCQEASKQNLFRTKFFSPGSQDWNISQQKTIFQLIPAHQIGITLTDSYMMIPQKSLSWLIGLGKNLAMPFAEEGHSCKTCQAENCQFRKKFDNLWNKI